MDRLRSAGTTAAFWSPLLLAYGLFGNGCAHMDALPSAQQDGKTFRSIGIATASAPGSGRQEAESSASELRSTAPPPGAADPRASASLRTSPEPAAPIPSPPPAIAIGPPPVEPATAPEPLPLPTAPPLIAGTTPPIGAEPGPEPAIDPSGSNRARLTPVKLVAEARKAVDSLPGYQVKLDRQERVGPKLQDRELVILSIRRSPRAVRIEWPSGPNKGRDVLFARGDGPDVMHVNMPGALVPRITLPVNSPLARRNSRHSIDDAGLDAIVGYMERWIEEAPDKARYQGSEIPPSYGKPCVRLAFEGVDGEVRVVHLDAQSHLPVLIHVTAANGDLLEDCGFSDLRTDCPELAAAEAFDPVRRWGQPRGLLPKRKPAAAEPGPETPASETPTADR